ncbi:hypothetical protein CD798_15635 [Bacillaceae bacterium SAOS 7]|nr:hypothetical protein CD798_15635 [Bacillaceae bacterium SAOS 7]
MFIQLKRTFVMLVALVLLTPLFSPFGEKAAAYGVMNHERVVDAGNKHFVILKEDGSVWSWGDNTFGQLGSNGISPSSNKPAPIQKQDGNRLLNIKAIAAGGDHTVALDNNGNVWTWGRNAYGQLGHSASVKKNEHPTQVKELSNIIAVAAGDHHTLAVDVSGQVWAWGRNAYGQLGSSVGSTMITPTLVSSVSNVIAVAAGAEHSVALKRDGTVWAWGRNTVGQLGNGETTDVNYTPMKVPGLTNIMEIAAGANHTVALKQDRTTVWAWGSNSYGQLGDGGREQKLYPIQVEGMTNVESISTGANHTMAIKEGGSVWMWGRNASGTQSIRTTPIQVKGMTNAVAIGGGGYDFDDYTLAISQEGTVWSWDKMSSDSTTKLPIFKQVSGIDNVMRYNEFPFVQGGQVLLRYIGDANTNSVKVNGSFNDWVDLPLQNVGGNVWELQVNLAPGEYNYGFIVNGKWTLDPLNRRKTVDDFGSPFSVLKVLPYATTGPSIDNREVTFIYDSYADHNKLELDAETEYVAVRGSFSNWVEIPLEKQTNNTWTLTKTIEPGDYYYTFVVRDKRSSNAVERIDALNPNIETNSVTGLTRNKLHVDEELVIKVPVTGITVDKGPNLDLVVGEQETIRETVRPSNASNKNVIWTSSNPSIVNVDATGKLTALSKGTAVVAVSTVDGGKIAMVNVTVNERDNAVSYPRVGYKDQGHRTGVSTNKSWKISFSEELDWSTVHLQSVYVLNDSGVKVPIAHISRNNGRTLELRPADGFQYQRGATYYLFVEKTVQTKYGKALKEPVQMKFTIGL